MFYNKLVVFAASQLLLNQSVICAFYVVAARTDNEAKK
jgi:hypothetical protein